ncbi:MAG: hypothetical protein H0U66_13500 [Gemmatimonadaceae bacterium]|nr:hypothetical protein [Gemmatimonadaceae bacterium]
MQATSTASTTHAVITKVVVLTVLAVIVAACRGGDSTSPPPGGNPDVWNDVASRTWTLAGQSEGYKCLGTQLSADEYITGFRLAAESAAQAEMLLFVMDTPPTLGSFDCSSDTGGGHLVYAASTGTTPIEFRAGQGVHVAAGKYLLLNSHVHNATGASVTDSTRIEGRVGTSSDVTTPLEMILAGKLAFSLPADDAPVVINTGCSAGSDQHFVALIPLMRSLGVHAKLAVSSASDTVPQPIYDAAFNPAHVLYTSLTTDLLVPATGHLSLSCTFNNTTGHSVIFGESASQELCFTGVYRYPVATGTYDFLSCARNGSFDFRRPEA